MSNNGVFGNCDFLWGIMKMLHNDKLWLLVPDVLRSRSKCRGCFTDSLSTALLISP